MAVGDPQLQGQPVCIGPCVPLSCSLHAPHACAAEKVGNCGVCDMRASLEWPQVFLSRARLQVGSIRGTCLAGPAQDSCDSVTVWQLYSSAGAQCASTRDSDLVGFSRGDPLRKVVWW